MASLLFTVGGAVVNGLAFSDTTFAFGRFTDHGKEECKRHDLAHEKLQRARDEWNKDRMKRLEAMLECYRVFSKQIKVLPPEPQLSDFYHPSEAQKSGELLFVAVGTGIATYALYKYLK